jgi:hypothetical protein
MSEGWPIALDGDLNVGPDGRMRSRAQRSESSMSHPAVQSHEIAAAFPAPRRRASARAVGVSRSSAAPGLASTRPEPPVETDAWWLSRSPGPTFARRRIELAAEHGRSLGAAGASPGRIVVEFNGASFGGAVVSANEGRYELELGDALAAEMASVLDDEDGLSIELLTGRAAPTLAIHPYVSASDEL